MYFDNAATTLKKPDSVVEAVVNALTHYGNPGRGTHESSLSATRCVYETRVKIAKLIGAKDPAQISFTANATMALNIAINGLINPSDNVITTATEHNSVLRPLYRLAGIDNNSKIEFFDNVYSNKNIRKEHDIQLTIIGTNDEGVLDINAFKKEISTEVDVVIINHASNVTGNINDIKTIIQLAHQNGAKVIVDASQTIGAIDIDVETMDVDILCFTGHKSLYGPQGTGGLYVSPNINLRPLLVGGSGVQSYNKEHPEQMPTALETGTINVHGIAGLNASLQFIIDTGIESISKHEKNLLFKFYEGIKDIPGVKVYGDFTTINRCPICSINIKNLDSSIISDKLSTQFNIATRPGAHCAPLMHKELGTVNTGVVRFSFSYFNTEDEINSAIKAIKQLAKIM